MFNEKIKQTVNWILHSGIQNTDGVCDANNFSVAGSFNAWYDLFKKNYPLAYTEISGYGLTALVYLYDELKHENCFNCAKRTADWLLKIQERTGAFPTAFYFFDDSPQKPKIFCTFDAGMVLNGLVNYYRQSDGEEYLIAAKKTADWISSLQNKNGLIPAMVDETGAFKDNSKTWSSQSGAFHAKLAIGFLNLHDVTKKEKYLVFARKICDYALKFMQTDGQIFTYGQLKGSHLHPHNYAAEGLFAAGKYLEEPKYLESAKKATRWAVSKSNKGVVPRFKHGDKFNYNERVDILSQTYRLAVLLGLNDNKEEEILKKILDYQYWGEDLKQHGGFMFGKLSSGETVPHINSWVSFFALQALKLKKNQNFRFYYLI